MNRRQQRLGVRGACLLIILCMGSWTTCAWSEPLTLGEAGELAVSRDPSLTALAARASALDEQAVASAQLPDPKLKLGAAALPIDTFDLDQEPMTQLMIGVQQYFPPGDSRRLQGQSLSARSESVDAQWADRRLATLRTAREWWLETFFRVRASEVLTESRAAFADLLAITRDAFASGRAQRQDVYRAQLELSRIEDRLVRNRQALEEARAQLSRWVGDDSRRPLPAEWPRLPEPGPVDLQRHPGVMAWQSEMAAREASLDAAREAYRPGWMLDVTYGDRSGQSTNGAARPDFISATVSVDLPLFRARRQDRSVAARQLELDEALALREAARRDLAARLDRATAQLDRWRQQAQLYDQRLLPEAEANARAALDAFQSGVGDLQEVVRARILEFELQLEWLRARIDGLIALAELDYLAGEAS